MLNEIISGEFISSELISGALISGALIGMFIDKLMDVFKNHGQ